MTSENQKAPRSTNWTVIAVVGFLVLGTLGFTYVQAIRERNVIEQLKNELEAKRQQTERDQAAADIAAAQEAAIEKRHQDLVDKARADCLKMEDFNLAQETKMITSCSTAACVQSVTNANLTGPNFVQTCTTSRLKVYEANQ